MPAVETDFDFKISIIQPELTRGLPSSSKDRINLSGEFIYTPPAQINPTFSAQTTELKPEDVEDTIESLNGDLKEQREQIDRLLAIIDQRCSHLIATYNPNLKKDEAIAEACEKIFGVADGRITYKMYAATIEKLQKLELFMGHRSIQNQGLLDGA